MNLDNIDYLILHHSAGQDTPGLEWDDIKAFHTRVRGWRDTGYHVVIENIAGIYVPLLARPWSLAGAHAPGYNGKSLGICVVGNFETTPVPVACSLVVTSTLTWLCRLFHIPASNVLGHRETKATACPGQHWHLDGLRTSIAHGLPD